jgi:hypothetical protein
MVLDANTGKTRGPFTEAEMEKVRTSAELSDIKVRDAESAWAALK